MTLLTRIAPAQNMRRFYRIEASPDLFGGIQIIRHWGQNKSCSKSYAKLERSGNA